MSKKKIEKEKKHLFRKYASVIKAVIVLIVLVLLLVGTLLFKPVKKEDVKEPGVLDAYDLLVNKNDATCDGMKAVDIKEVAAKINVSYEVIDDYFFGYFAETDEDLNGNGVIDEEPVVENIGYALKLKLNNLKDSVYVVISNDLNEDVKTFHISDADSNGAITWYEGETTFVRTYNIKVYSANPDCSNELYREFTVSAPKYNIFSRSYDCKIEPYKDMDICNLFTFSTKSTKEEEKEFSDTIRKVNLQKLKEKEKQNNNNTQEEDKKGTVDLIKDFVTKNKEIAIAAGVGVVILIGLVVVLIKKKGKK